MRTCSWLILFRRLSRCAVGMRRVSAAMVGVHTELAAADQEDEERRHKRVEMLERTIAKTPSEGLVGIGQSWRSPQGELSMARA